MAWIGVYRALSDTCMTIGFYKNIFYTENDKIMIFNDVFIFITRLLMVCDGKTECRHQIVAQLDGLVEHLTWENSGGSSSNPGHHFSNPITFGALMTNPWNWQDDSCQGKEPKQWMCDLQGSRSFESGGMVWWLVPDSSVGSAPDYKKFRGRWFESGPGPSLFLTSCYRSYTVQRSV